MRQKLKIILKLIAIGSVFLLSGCETELETVEQNNGYTIKEYSFKKAQTLSEFRKTSMQLDEGLKLYQRQKQKTNNNSLNRSIADIISAIDSTTVKEVDGGSYKTYTMLLKKRRPKSKLF
jgi:hypothetical protein